MGTYIEHDHCHDNDARNVNQRESKADAAGGEHGGLIQVVQVGDCLAKRRIRPAHSTSSTSTRDSAPNDTCVSPVQAPTQ